MLFRAPVIILAALLAKSALATCPAGSYYRRISSNKYACTVCPSGQYTTSPNLSDSCNQCSAGQGHNSDHTGCVPCVDGTYSSRGTGCQNCAAGKTSTKDHKHCTNCSGETYSRGGTSCMTCPAGKQRNDDRTDCDECSPGSYNSTPGGTCKKCPAGQFNNVSGAESCCDCCAGYYSTNSRTSCSKCEDYNQYAPRKKYSAVGSNSSGDCKLVQGTLPTPPATCTQPANNACPTTTPGGPQGSPTSRKRRDDQCGNGLISCPIHEGRGPSKCVNPQTDDHFCGGCVGDIGIGSGEDCSLSGEHCVNGHCVSHPVSRREGVKSPDGSSCVLAPCASGSPVSDGLHAQDGETKKRRSSAKRAVRHKIY
ncbi:hypothetical protein M407DRAFT_34410 [Tulasnella calospora MUT 4182]|uniref:Tyrosine-protein kinase ephrin type A/B receptor-like domain-containing protein n=1 Tax=Tulasnella calospora MUT 4182 TaxID=1051891 RepID=A0A0C3L2K8_9AGAM|nr:hypothetical protein M407DRAFT_34410 [Tulasnella calospora MUT 4182]